MKAHDLPPDFFFYVATPYSKYAVGIHAAFRDACAITGQLLQAGLKVYSPIAHTHPIAIHGGIDPLDHSIWLPFDAAIMAKSDAIIVVKMQGWAESYGVRHEIDTFKAAGKPIYWLDPDMLEIGRGCE